MQCFVIPDNYNSKIIEDIVAVVAAEIDFINRAAIAKKSVASSYSKRYSCFTVIIFMRWLIVKDFA